MIKLRATGAVLVVMCTGLLMWFMGLLLYISRTSASFVYDCLAWAITLVLIGHMRKAYQDPEAKGCPATAGHG